jgi:hypothetical protein
MCKKYPYRSQSKLNLQELAPFQQPASTNSRPAGFRAISAAMIAISEGE